MAILIYQNTIKHETCTVIIKPKVFELSYRAVPSRSYDQSFLMQICLLSMQAFHTILE